MIIMSLIRRILNKLYYVYANRSDESKLQYLRKLGCKVGDRTRFIGDAYLGTEPYLSREKLVSYFRAFLMARVKTYMAQVLKAQKISIFEIVNDVKD